MIILSTRCNQCKLIKSFLYKKNIAETSTIQTSVDTIPQYHNIGIYEFAKI